MPHPSRLRRNSLVMVAKVQKSEETNKKKELIKCHAKKKTRKKTLIGYSTLLRVNFNTRGSSSPTRCSSLPRLTSSGICLGGSAVQDAIQIQSGCFH